MLYLWEEFPTLELERLQLSSMGDGGNITPNHTILDFFEYERVRGLMGENSDWLEVSDPDDPPTQLEDGEGSIPLPPPKQNCLYAQV